MREDADALAIPHRETVAEMKLGSVARLGTVELRTDDALPVLVLEVLDPKVVQLDALGEALHVLATLERVG